MLAGAALRVMPSLPLPGPRRRNGRLHLYARIVALTTLILIFAGGTGRAATGLDLILAYVRDRFGPAAAFEAETMFLHDSARQASDPHFGPGLRGSRSDRLRKVVARMAATMDAPQPLAELARTANLSERSLNRMFQRELGQSPARYMQSLRLARARDLACHTDLGLDQIALRCGFSGAPALTRAFRHRTGRSIRQPN